MFKFKRNDSNAKDFMEGYELGYRAGRSDTFFHYIYTPNKIRALFGVPVIKSQEVNKMAIKVIEHGTRRQIRCSKCNALLSYDMNDDVTQEPVDDFLTGRWVRKFIICPECDEKIVLNNRR